MKIPKAGRQCRRGRAQEAVGVGVWRAVCAGPSRVATPGRACAVCTQKVKCKTIIGRFPFPRERLAFQVALMACE